MPLNQQNIDELQGMLNRGDRGGYYVRYAELVRADDPAVAQEALFQAQISTYSGWFGGMAIGVTVTVH